MSSTFPVWRKCNLLTWCPVPVDISRGAQSKGMALPAIAPPLGLKDFQVGWFWNLFWALAKAEGYLPFGPDIWKIAGALTRARWDANNAAVLAAFDFTTPGANGKRESTDSVDVRLYYQPLLQIIELQKSKLGKKSATFTTTNSAGDSLSPSQSGFDFSSQNQEQSERLASALSCPPPAKKVAGRYSQSDFDERDMRLVRQELAQVNATLQGVWISDEDPPPAGAVSKQQVFRTACKRAGIGVDRARSLIASAGIERSA